MNSTKLDLPPTMLAGHTAVALLAAIGILVILRLPITSGISGFLVPIFTVLFTVGLVRGGQQIIDRARAGGLGEGATDPATGLTTATAAEQVLHLEFAAAQRGRPLTVVLIRIEDFPRYTVRHGRAVADQLVRNAGRVLRKYRRRMHVAAPHGPGPATFLSILSGMDPRGACVYGARIRNQLLVMSGVPKVPGVSVGIVAYDVSMGSPRELIAQAERALRRAGEAGGKVVVLGQVADEAAS